MSRHHTILDTIGNTPLVKLQKLAPADINVWVKLESFNPSGSVKDRMARAIIEEAEKSGALCPGQTIIDATSGNTGISLAMVCASKGYPLVVTMAENFSVERRKLLRFLGARVVLTPAAEKGTGMLAKAEELAQQHGWFLCRQFDNEVNAEVHARTTAQEIIADFAAEPLHYWVSGFGSGGTLKGVASALRQALPETRIVAAEPDNSPVLGSGIAQPRAQDGRPNASHPLFRPHLMQGWSPDFISSLTESARTQGLIDEVVPVAGSEALILSQDLAQQEGIFVGISSGATLAAALTVARRSPPGTNIVCMLPDTGERYLSTPLFEHIGEAMNDEELALSRSTPRFRFDAPSAPAQISAAAPSHEADAEATALVAQLTRDEPVLMFALEWCEFCWSARKLFSRFNIPCRSIDLDAVAWQEGDMGAKIRDVLQQRTGSRTIPQIFIGGHLVGGCTGLFDGWRDGSTQALLRSTGLALADSEDFDPYSLLPGWLQPRKSA